jgi:hypothetical protein
MNNNKEMIIQCLDNLKNSFMELSATWDKNQLHYVDLILEENYPFKDENFPQLVLNVINWADKSKELLNK